MADKPLDETDRLLAPYPSDDRGMRTRDGGYNRPAWTPNGFLRRGHAFLLKCNACGKVAEADLQALVDAGCGDWPMVTFRGKWRCSCGSADVEATR